jgi:hypothetical protein
MFIPPQKSFQKIVLPWKTFPKTINIFIFESISLFPPWKIFQSYNNFILIMYSSSWENEKKTSKNLP